MLKTYIVNYSGLWLGGTAIVRAESEQEAIEEVRSHRFTTNFTHVDCQEIKIKRGVIYNDNGDY
jgi:hypothetical protein